ncbi:hypothetical protein HZB90_00230 [archaeon]|nr:hypothetical protein [archaeon]
MGEVDKYIAEVVGKGDEGSALLAKLVAHTLKNCSLVDVVREGMNGIAVLRVPEGHKVMVHSAGGNHEESEPALHAASLVDMLVAQAKVVGAKPVAFANVIDASTSDRVVIYEIGAALKARADRYGLAIMNGEFAILGERVNCSANISGTMISLVDESSAVFKESCFTQHGDVAFQASLFDPKGMAVYMNSDGVGTKMEFYERKGDVSFAGIDFAAMNLDDAVKLGAVAKVISGVVEMNGCDIAPQITISKMEKMLCNRLLRSHVTGDLRSEFVGDRLRSYEEGVPAFNVSGSTVSVIDEEYLKHPLVPSAGEYLVAIADMPNPRSNGITSKRELMNKVLGIRWHKTKIGRAFLDYLATPSTLLYPVFRELADNRLATSFYHMSGGAYKGKLARPLAKHGLFADIDGTQLFRPDWRELAIQHLSGKSNGSLNTCNP